MHHDGEGCKFNFVLDQPPIGGKLIISAERGDTTKVNIVAWTVISLVTTVPSNPSHLLSINPLRKWLKEEPLRSMKTHTIREERFNPPALIPVDSISHLIRFINLMLSPDSQPWKMSQRICGGSDRQERKLKLLS